MRKELDVVCLLLNWCGTRRISLDHRIESLNLFSLDEIEALRVAFRADLRTARKRANGDKSTNLPEVVGNGHWRNRLQACADYLVWRVNDIILRLDIRDPRRLEAMLEQAKREAVEGTLGTGPWVVHNERMVAGLRQAIAVHQDYTITDGTIVQA